MKKFLFSTLLVLVSVSFAGAFNYAGEDQAQSGSVATEDMNSVVDQFARTLKGVQSRQAGTSKALKALGDDIKVVKQDQSATKNAVTSLATGMSDVAKEMGKNSDLTKEVGNNLGDQIKNNAWVLGIVLVVAMIVIGAWFARRNRVHVAEAIEPVLENVNRFVDRADAITEAVSDANDNTNRRIDEVMAEVRVGFAATQTKLSTLPADVAKAVNTLIESPITFEAGGYSVSYQSPIGGIREGYYLKIYVPKGAAGDAVTYERATCTKHGVVRRETIKTMEQYFRGDFNVPEFALQKAVIERLHSLKELTWRTI